FELAWLSCGVERAEPPNEILHELIGFAGNHFLFLLDDPARANGLRLCLVRRTVRRMLRDSGLTNRHITKPSLKRTGFRQPMKSPVENQVPSFVMTANSSGSPKAHCHRCSDMSQAFYRFRVPTRVSSRIARFV